MYVKRLTTSQEERESSVFNNPRSPVSQGFATTQSPPPTQTQEEDEEMSQEVRTLEDAEYDHIHQYMQKKQWGPRMASEETAFVIGMAAGQMWQAARSAFSVAQCAEMIVDAIEAQCADAEFEEVIGAVQEQRTTTARPGLE